MNAPSLLGLFQKRIEGDDALLRLAQLRFRQAGLAAEMYAVSPGDLEMQLTFRPSEDCIIVAHLPRSINLLDAGSRELILAFARSFAGRIRGMVVHDQLELSSQTTAYRQAVQELEAQLSSIPSAPWVFIEYAAGLEPGCFVEFHETVQSLQHISACIDIGHIGIRQARAAFAKSYGGLDACSLKHQPDDLRPVIAVMQSAVKGVLPNVEGVISAICAIGKPVHFHLHDGHPLSMFSPFGVSDHLSFLAEIPLSFEHERRFALPCMFGPSGLNRVIRTAINAARPEMLSFTLEIHPPEGRLPLNEATEMFTHWRDKMNAERMNYWLAVLAQNTVLLREAVQNALDEKSAG